MCVFSVWLSHELKKTFGPTCCTLGAPGVQSGHVKETTTAKPNTGFGTQANALQPPRELVAHCVVTAQHAAAELAWHPMIVCFAHGLIARSLHRAPRSASWPVANSPTVRRHRPVATALSHRVTAVGCSGRRHCHAATLRMWSPSARVVARCTSSGRTRGSGSRPMIPVPATATRSWALARVAHRIGKGNARCKGVAAPWRPIRRQHKVMHFVQAGDACVAKVVQESRLPRQGCLAIRLHREVPRRGAHATQRRQQEVAAPDGGPMWYKSAESPRDLLRRSPSSCDRGAARRAPPWP